MSWGVGRSLGWDPSLLWLWHRAAAIALFQPPPWELLYAEGAALKSAKTKTKKTKNVKQFKKTLILF